MAKRDMKLGQVLVASLAIVAAVTLVIGCTGNTSGDSTDSEVEGGPKFDSSNDSAGALTLDFTSTSIPVSQTAEFRAFVTDSNGAPVPDVTVFCDSEQGVAIIEPSTGKEITNSRGAISGTIGCSAPGSFKFGCALPGGSGRRKLASIACTGNIPVGFDGFEGAAGGTLGGGVQGGDDGGPGGTNSGARITKVLFIDDGSVSSDIDTTTNTSSIDVVQSFCFTAGGSTDSSTPPPTPTPTPSPTPTPQPASEPFFDSFVKAKVVNNTNQAITFTRARYKIANVDSTGGATSNGTFTSSWVSLVSEASPVEENGGTITVLAPFLDAGSGGKAFPGASANIGFASFKSVRIELEGTNSLGDVIVIAASATASFDGFNNCPAGTTPG